MRVLSFGLLVWWLQLSLLVIVESRGVIKRDHHYVIDRIPPWYQDNRTPVSQHPKSTPPENNGNEDLPTISKKFCIESERRNDSSSPKTMAVLLKTKLKIELIKPEIQFMLEGKWRECALLDTGKPGYYRQSKCVAYVPKLPQENKQELSGSPSRLKSQTLKRTLDLIAL